MADFSKHSKKSKKDQEAQVPFSGPEATTPLYETEDDAQTTRVTGGENIQSLPRTDTTLVQRPVAGGIAKQAPSAEVIERLNDALESLASFTGTGASLPLIRFKEGFTLYEGSDEVQEFEGVIIFTKQSNVFYKNRFKPGQVTRPDCFSPDGIKPTTPDPVAPSCANCPNNAFGSAKEGDGKACKNTRPVFVLVWNAEMQQYAVIPKVLRIPPTSLTLMRSYAFAVASDFGGLHAVRTKFSTFQKRDDQTHYNIGMKVSGRLTQQEKSDIQAVRNGWMQLMTEGNFGIDEETVDGPQRPAPAPVVDASAPTF